jgi:hypothetical protein
MGHHQDVSSWERAQQRYEQQTREWRLARDDSTRLRTRLRAAAARVELYDVLVADGWLPDPMVEDQVRLDRQLLHEATVAETARPVETSQERRTQTG